MSANEAGLACPSFQLLHARISQAPTGVTAAAFSSARTPNSLKLPDREHCSAASAQAWLTMMTWLVDALQTREGRELLELMCFMLATSVSWSIG
jgi:hypothetical protein